VKSRRASILVIVLITLVLTAAALVAFLDRAANDLLVAARASQADRLRPDAYSALEVVLGVLEDFRESDNGLRHPSEGWGDPLAWAGWAPADGYTIEVALQDESGKMPLRSVTATEMLDLFQYWGMSPPDAQRMTDSIYSWMHQNYTPTSAVDTDYEQSAIPYDPPYRPMRSIGELAAIDTAKDYFYTNGVPNAWWWRFYNDFSVYNFPRANVNGANGDVLAAVGQFTLEQQQGVASYLAGTSDRVTLNRTWFQSNTDLIGVVGQNAVVSGFAYTSAALRILITVHDGKAIFRLLAVVAPTAGGGATSVQTTATDVKQSQQNAQTGETNNNQSVTPAAAPTVVPNTAQNSAAASINIRYPFRFLALEENENIPNVPSVAVPEAPDPAAPPLNPFSPVVPPLPNQ
jgi:general secretion pathway protein K